MTPKQLVSTLQKTAECLDLTGELHPDQESQSAAYIINQAALELKRLYKLEKKLSKIKIVTPDGWGPVL